MSILSYKSAKVDITPNFSTRLPNLASPLKSVGIFNRIEINAHVFSQGEKSVFLFSVDVLLITASLKKRISDSIKRFYKDIKDVDIVIVASHTHYAPCIEERRVALGEMDTDFFEYLGLKIHDLVENLINRSAISVKIEALQGTSKGLTLSRRRSIRDRFPFLKKHIALEPNFIKDQVDELRILRILEITTGNVLGAIWSFPCHPTNLFVNNFISSEYIGEVREEIRSVTGINDLAVIYLPGFAGDLRAYPPINRSFSKFIRTLFSFSYPVRYYRFTCEEDYREWVGRIILFFKKTWCETPLIIDDIEIGSVLVEKNIHALLGLVSEEMNSILFRKISFGNNLAFYTVSAEVVSGYSSMLSSIAKEKFTFFTGYADEVYGYLPLDSQIVEGGYESVGFFNLFLIKGSFQKGIESKIKACIQEIN